MSVFEHETSSASGPTQGLACLFLPVWDRTGGEHLQQGARMEVEGGGSGLECTAELGLMSA